MDITTYQSIIHPAYRTSVCARYQLHYKNRYGGYDTFVIEGKVIKADEYERYDIKRSYDNNTHAFGRTTYLNDIRTKYELHTGWLTDEQSERLAFHLLPSDRVYLHDTEQDKIWPCVITNSSTTYKKAKDQDGLVSYTINVELSQNQVIS